MLPTARSTGAIAYDVPGVELTHVGEDIDAVIHRVRPKPSSELQFDSAGPPAHRTNDDLDVVTQLRDEFQQRGFSEKSAPAMLD